MLEKLKTGIEEKRISQSFYSVFTFYFSGREKSFKIIEKY